MSLANICEVMLISTLYYSKQTILCEVGVEIFISLS